MDSEVETRKLPPHRRGIYGLLRRSADVLKRLRTESLGELSEVKAFWSHGRAVGILNSFSKIRLGAKRTRHEFVLAEATDHPIGRAGRTLDDEIPCLAIPGHAPTHGPAVAGSHGTAIPEVDAAVRDAAIVVEHSGRPALV